MTADFPTIRLAGTAVDLSTFPDALEFITQRASDRSSRPLGVASINLDHIHHFGIGGVLDGALESDSVAVQWLNLLDGAPVVAAANRATGGRWPRIAGSDIIGPLLDQAVEHRLRVGFFGGMADTHALLLGRLGIQYPTLDVAGLWAPSRAELDDPDRSAELARAVALAHVDILVVSLGKPRQELWISRYGAETNAGVLLAFGAVVDFLAGSVNRAPAAVSRVGMEWAWRLALEPRRLARRYLIEGPGAYRALRQPVVPVGSREF